MMKDDWAGSETDEYSNNLQQRTEELYRIPDADQDSEGLIECAAYEIGSLCEAIEKK